MDTAEDNRGGIGWVLRGVDSPGLAFGLDVTREVGWGWAGDGG